MITTPICGYSTDELIGFGVCRNPPGCTGPHRFGPPPGPCVNCEVREATCFYAVDSTAALRGWTEPWCELCAVKIQLEEARKSAVRIPDLEKRLATAILADGNGAAALYLYPNGAVMAFDRRGQQVPDVQGISFEKGDIAAAMKLVYDDARFYFASVHGPLRPTTRDEFLRALGHRRSALEAT